MATVAFMGFLFMSGIYESEISLVITGLVFIFGVLFITKASKSLVLDTACIALYVSGYFLLGFGLGELEMDENMICLIFIPIAIIALFISQNYVLAFLSTLIVSCCLLFLIGENRLYDGIHIYIAGLTALMSIFYLNEAKIIRNNNKLSNLYNPIRIGLTFSLIMGLMFIGTKNLTGFNIHLIWLSSIITIGAVLYVNSLVVKKINIADKQTEIGIYGAVVLALLPPAFAPAIAGAILIMLLSFYVNYRTGFVLGLLSFIYFLSQYYYDLKLTLLTKSGILFLSGILFILIFLYLTKYQKSNEKI
jgi:hypothetical protein